MSDRERHLEDIRKAIRDRRAALALGAGISKPSEMPMWSELISKMMGYAIEWESVSACGAKKGQENIKNTLDLARKLIEKKIFLPGRVNTLESAEYIAQFFDDRHNDVRIREKLPETAIRTMIKKMIDNTLTPKLLLQRDNPSGMGSPTDRVSASELDGIARLNSMFAVSYLLYAENGIRQAMTYNYDPLVQEHMMEIYGTSPSCITTHPGKWNPMMGGRDSREIYHVHGFVCGNRHEEKRLENVYPDESGPLVLSEDSYYRIEQKEAYNWSSSIQSYFLNKYSCVFVGFSAEDYNFRRILRQTNYNMCSDAENAEPRHFLIMTIDDWIKDTYISVCSACWKEYEKKIVTTKPSQKRVAEAATCLLQNILDSREKYWRRFGIIPIWVTVKEIPSLLVSLLNP